MNTFDMLAFCRALAKEIGGSIDPEMESEIYCRRGVINFSDDIKLTVRQQSGAKSSRVIIGGMSELYLKLKRNNTFYQDYDFPSCTFDFSRPISAIAKTVNKKIIAEMRPIVEKIKDDLNKSHDDMKKFTMLQEQLKIDIPGIQIRNGNDYEVNICISNEHVYFCGRVTREGTIHFDRIYIKSFDVAKAVLSILSKGVE